MIANTGDDIEIYGAYVSPDPDLVTFWLADRIDERGWGLDGDSFTVMDGLRELGDEVWFNLGDRTWRSALKRAQALAQRRRLTEAQRELERALGVAARRAADERPPGAHAGDGRRALVDASGVPDQGARPGRGPGRAVPRRARGRHDHAEVLAAIAGAGRS